MKTFKEIVNEANKSRNFSPIEKFVRREAAVLLKNPQEDKTAQKFVEDWLIAFANGKKLPEGKNIDSSTRKHLSNKLKSIFF